MSRGENVVPLGAASKRIALRPVSPEDAAIANSLFTPRAPLSIDVDGIEWRLTVMARVDGQGSSSPGPWLAGTIAGAPAAVALDNGLARRLLGLPAEGADPETVALALEAALAPALDSWEADDGPAVRFTGYDAGAPEGTVGATLCFDGPEPHRLPVALTPAAAEALAVALARASAVANGADDMTLPVTLELTPVVLRLSELSAAGPGDVIALATTCDWRLRVGPRHAAPARRTDAGAELTGPFLTAEGDSAMPDDAHALEDLDIRLSFVAGQTEMTLAKLKALAPGTVVPLAGRSDGTVEILANGRRIGTGELVDIGGQAGVEIKSLFDDH